RPRGRRRRDEGNGGVCREQEALQRAVPDRPLRQRRVLVDVARDDGGDLYGVAHAGRERRERRGRERVCRNRSLQERLNGLLQRAGIRGELDGPAAVVGDALQLVELVG